MKLWQDKSTKRWRVEDLQPSSSQRWKAGGIERRCPKACPQVSDAIPQRVDFRTWDIVSQGSIWHVCMRMSFWWDVVLSNSATERKMDDANFPIDEIRAWNTDGHYLWSSWKRLLWNYLLSRTLSETLKFVKLSDLSIFWIVLKIQQYWRVFTGRSLS